MRVTRSIVPNLFTLMNLFMGFNSIVAISHDDYWRGAMFILLAGVFDMLDGVVARLIKSTSEFGAELDSLCDVVSFGVAPSFLLWKVYFYQFPDYGILLAALPALGGAIRLARFNVKLTSFEDKNYFSGLPIPSSAMTIASYIVFFQITNEYPQEVKNIAIIVVTLLSSFAMVSTVKFDNMPRPTKKSIKQRPAAAVIFLIGLIVSAISLGKYIFPFMIFYIIASFIRQLVFWIREGHEASDDLDESDAPEPEPYDT
jgi:CDP-diacylglycerol---serine O-phosphatidyltransferase